MGFAVYHMEKGNGGAGGIGRHIDRIESKYGYTSFQHSDESKRPLNQNYILNDHCNKYRHLVVSSKSKQARGLASLSEQYYIHCNFIEKFTE